VNRTTNTPTVCASSVGRTVKAKWLSKVVYGNIARNDHVLVMICK